MADGPDRDEKTEDPTAKRKKELIDQGDVLQSKDLATALGVLGGACWLMVAGPWMLTALSDMLVGGLTFGRDDVVNFDPSIVIGHELRSVAMPLFSLLLLTMAIAIVTPAVFGSLGFRWSAIAFKPSKLNPISGFKRIFGMKGLIEIFKASAKVLVLGGIGWWLLSKEIANITGYGNADIGMAIRSVGKTFVYAFLVMALGLLLIAGVDVPTQIIQRRARMRMTKQEVKDEGKQSEGSPEMKGRIRQRQAEVLRGSVRVAVTEATVVLTNPTHFAVALRYRPGVDAAPQVMAKGRGATAEAIRALAREKKVPMLSYPQLTRSLYFTTRHGQEIREDLFLAVAAVLAFVFRLDQAMADGVRQPVVDVPVELRYDEEGRRGA